jgi:predicted metal-dependent enzyme (double-stranded beta helix superfamily)
LIDRHEDLMSASKEQGIAVTTLIGETQRILRTEGTTRAALAKVLDGLVTLAARRSLWIDEAFSPPADGERHARYLIHEEPDKTYALYLNIMLPGNLIIPHNHTTWAAIAAVEGIEHNHLYRRTDDGSRQGFATLAHETTVEVGPGTGIALLPDDIHAVEIRGATAIRHLHLYGKSLDTLDARVRFDLATGTYEAMPIGVKTRTAS